MNNFNYKKYNYLLLGFVIVTYIIYLRVFRERLPKDLYVGNPINLNLCLIVFIGFFMSLYIIYVNTTLLYKKTKKENLLQKFSSKIAQIIQEALEEVFNFIGQVIGEKSYTFLSSFAQNFHNIFFKYHAGILFIISYSVRCIIFIVFFCDIFIFFRFNYFYKSLILLIIPIIISIITFLLKNFASNLELMSSFLDTEEAEELGDPVTKFTPSLGNEDIDLSYHVEQFILCTKIQNYLDIYNDFKDYYTPRCNILLYSLYAIGWAFIITKNFFFC